MALPLLALDSPTFGYAFSSGRFAESSANSRQGHVLTPGPANLDLSLFGRFRISLLTTVEGTQFPDVFALVAFGFLYIDNGRIDSSCCYHG